MGTQMIHTTMEKKQKRYDKTSENDSKQVCETKELVFGDTKNSS